jgi:hypothetical protein
MVGQFAGQRQRQTVIGERDGQVGIEFCGPFDRCAAAGMSCATMTNDQPA